MEKKEYLNIITLEEYKLINELVQNGKLQNYHYLVEMFGKEKNDLLNNMNKTPNEIYDLITYDYFKIVKGISMLVPGLSTGIKDAKSGVSIYTYNGEVSKDGENIDENTRFDLASSTKLFTSLEALKQVEEGTFDLDKSVKYYNDKYSNLDIPVEKMAKFYYDLRTDGRLDERDGKVSLEEFKRRLYSTEIARANTFLYSDIPFIILKDILIESDEYFKKYFNEEMSLLQTSYDREFGTLTGGVANELNLVHDPKARVMEKYSLNPGHAGIYSTSKDLVKLFDSLNNGFLSNESIIKMITPALKSPILLNLDGTIAFNNEGAIKNINRGMGVYYKHPEGIRVSDMADVLSDETFAIAGFTGTYAVFDLKNELTANFLANPFSIAPEREVIIDNEKFKIADCGKSFENGTKFKISGKMIKVLDNEGNVIQNVPFTRITNTLKEEAIYTLLKLRLAKNVLMRKAEMEQSSILADEVIKDFEANKTLKGK